MMQKLVNTEENAERDIPSLGKPLNKSPKLQDLSPKPHYGSVHFTGGVLSGKSRLHSSPERARTNSLLISVPEEDQRMDVEHDNLRAQYIGGAPLDEEEEEEEEEWLLDEQLARQGLYRGSYSHLMAWYTLTPFATMLAFVFLAVLPIVAFPLDRNSPHSPYPYAPYLPYPFPELLTAAALWSMSQLLRDFLFSISTVICGWLHHASACTTLLAIALQSTSTVILQLIAVALLLITPSPGFDHPTWHDHAFRRVWSVSLGWAAAEAMVGIKQGYEGIMLYRDVLVTARRVSEEETPKVSALSNVRPTSSENSSPDTITSTVATSSGGRRDDSNIDGLEMGNEYHRLDVRDTERQSLLPRKPYGAQSFSKSALEMEVEDDLDQLITLKNREDLEEIYGIPFIHIPVFLSCLHRINSVLMSLGSFLLLSAAYLRSSFAPHVHRPSQHDNLHDATTDNPRLFSILSFSLNSVSNSNSGFLVSVVAVIIFQLILAILHTAWILPKIGVHTFVYVSLLISLAIFFAGLGFWEALV